MIDTKEFSEILNRHFYTLRRMLIGMRQLQRALVNKDFNLCSEMIEAIKREQGILEKIERERLQLLVPYALERAIREEEVTGQEIIACFLPPERKKIRLVLLQIKEITTHIQLISQSVARFSKTVGSAMKAAFDEIVSAKEYTYTQEGVRSSHTEDPLLCDSIR